MIVTDEAFDELLDRAALLEEDENGDEEAGEMRRRNFALNVDRAVYNVAMKRDGRDSHTQTLRRDGCRLHFVRDAQKIYLIACVALDEDEVDDAVDAADEDYSM